MQAPTGNFDSRVTTIVLASWSLHGLVSKTIHCWLEQFGIDVIVREAALDQTVQLLANSTELPFDLDTTIFVFLLTATGSMASTPSELDRLTAIHNLEISLQRIGTLGLKPIVCDSAEAAMGPRLAARGRSSDQTHTSRAEETWAAEGLDTGNICRRFYSEIDTGPKYEDEQPEAMAVLGTEIARRVYKRFASPFKVLVFDCDNTLWRGECAASDLETIAPDDRSLSLQRFALEKFNEGFLLCLVSKNDDADVQRMFQHPFMLLKEEHIVARRINFQPKSGNIIELATELNLGLDSFIFFDDEEFECQEVSFHCPEVLTLVVPQGTDELDKLLTRLWATDRWQRTAEDTNRTRIYRAEFARRELGTSNRAHDFIENLELTVSMQLARDDDFERLSQLSHRARQLQTAGNGISVHELRNLLTSGAFVWSIRASDRFGDHGIVGLIAATAFERYLYVSIFCMSCRALGKNIEWSMLGKLAEKALVRGCQEVRFSFVPGPRNAAAERLLRSVSERAEDHTFICSSRKLIGSMLQETQYGYRPDSAIAAKVEDSKIDTASDGVRHRMDGPIVQRNRLHTKLASDLKSPDTLLKDIQQYSSVSRRPIGRLVHPYTPTQQSLSKIWRRELKLGDVGIYDDLFDIIADSLIAVRILARINRIFGVKIPNHMLFDGAFTIAVLAEWLDLQTISLASELEISRVMTQVEELSDTEVSAKLRKLADL